ncbi:hypothetical protein MLD38_027976 [Melastoma candidum]|uniref:Uncharacterized protein n=1 Tax=Melastoma candidum TaxID=119954 RepID=A0ACB9MZG6_9MYRT|nr:hypothetical protein MLD38_027976 [Melastoma candidum]
MAASAMGAQSKILRRLLDKRETNNASLPINTVSFHLSSIRVSSCCIMSMNGCEGEARFRPAIGASETRTLPVSADPGSAMDRLRSAVSDLKENPPASSSGIIRLQAPITERVKAIEWLHSQPPRCRFPRVFFSPPSACTASGINGFGIEHDPIVVSVAGIGSAVFFRHLRPFSYHDWLSIKRFLPADSPLIRAYGAIRFDARSDVSAEWGAFGSFYFVIPQIELVELTGSCMLAATVAWDDSSDWPWENALQLLQSTIRESSSFIKQMKRHAPTAFILNSNHFPSKKNWDSTVNSALQVIKGQDSPLTKVVLARSSRYVTASDIDPIVWLASLQAEGENAYQFCLQPPGSPAFIGNTPEKLFHRSLLSISSEALAGTRVRGGSTAQDLQIELDLLSSPKDHLEFTIVRESIRRKLEATCSDVVVEPRKAVRKLPRVQHLHALLAGRLKREEDEYDLLASLHPTPAVCGFPTEEARLLIAETEVFDRGMYAGPVGWFGGRESEFAVGIRSALVGKEVGALLYAGTGIVEGSNASSEWNELQIKTSQFTKLLKLEMPSQKELMTLQHIQKLRAPA